MFTAIKSRWSGVKSRLRRYFSLVPFGIIWLAISGAAPLFSQDGSPLQVAPSEAATIEATSGESDEPLGSTIHSDVRTSSFQEITPDKTSLAELKKRMGDATTAKSTENETILTYQLGPFPRVEMIVIDDVVDSIVVYLTEAALPRDIAAELGLNDFFPVAIHGESGERLGLVYPERGVAFSFDPETLPPRVSQLVLSPISAEFFMLRAQDTWNADYARKMADANYALRLAPDNATAHWCKASVLEKARLYQSALSSTEDALNLQPDEPSYRLAWASIKAKLGEYRQALAETESLLTEQGLPLLLHARVEALLGDLTAEGPDHDHELAMEHHLRAVELAAPLASSLKPNVRRESRQFLVEVHLSVANDITRGDWASKKETAPKWLASARLLADKLIEEDKGDEIVRLLLLERALACYVGMKGAVDPTGVILQAIQFSEKLTKSAADAYRRREIQWMLVQSLTDAVRIEQLRGKSEQVEDYANQAVAILNTLASTEETTQRSDLLIGRLYFYVGSTFAIRDDDHQQAVRWYEKSQPFLTRVGLSKDSVDLGRHGQRFVSMAVSYWDAELPKEAISLTETGLDLMLVASEAGTLNPTALAVPYGNLAAMYQAVGRSEEAEQLAAKAALLDEDTIQR
jgi:tetratricopeptide (TPR) repeat protein